jgi:hypothetical protein
MLKIPHFFQTATIISISIGSMPTDILPVQADSIAAPTVGISGANDSAAAQ